MSDESISQTQAVEIEAEVRLIKTMADGTVNVTLNLPEYCLPQAAVIMGWVKMLVRAVIEVTDDERPER